MSIKRYGRVSVRRDLPKHNLEQGDVGTVVDFATDPKTGEEGCVLELYSGAGELLATITVDQDDVQPLQDNEILCVRKVIQPIQ